MTVLDLLLMVAAFTAAVRPLTPWRGSRVMTVVLGAVVAVALAAQLVLGTPRWQLTTVYLAALVAAGSAVIAVTGRRGWALGTTTATLGITGVVLGAALSWALPLPTLPPPDGPHAVGTVSTEITDDTRTERYGPDAGGPRRFVVQAFYPAAADPEGARAPVVAAGRGFTAPAAREVGLPSFMLDHLTGVTGNAVEHAPVTTRGPIDAEGRPRLPVVIASHGWTGFRTAQVDLYESLASHGYVVVAIDHTYGAMATAFPDGEVVPNDPDALPEDADPEAYDAAAARLVATYAGDISSTVEHLAAQGIDPLTDHLDLERIAVIGHSTGGGAAVRFCAEAPRCAAVVGYDPWVEPVPDAVIGSGLPAPLLSLVSEEWAGNGNDTVLRRLHAATDASQGRVLVADTLHRDVTVLRLLSPLAPQLGLVGSLPVEDTGQLVDEWTRRFLDHHLRGDGPDPLRAPPRFDAAVIDANGQAANR